MGYCPTHCKTCHRARNSHPQTLQTPQTPESGRWAASLAARTLAATLATPTQSRLSALALASLMTMAMLLGVNGLATSEATPAQLAHHQIQQAQQPA